MHPGDFRIAADLNLLQPSKLALMGPKRGLAVDFLFTTPVFFLLPSPSPSHRKLKFTLWHSAQSYAAA